MIPKKEGEKQASDFTLISLLHGVYKIMAKALALRLAVVMETIISYFQSSTIRGRQIHDSILIANELIDSRIREKKPGYAMKLDFYKAFDSFSWEYLDYMLDRCGFSLKWRSWVRACISSAHFSVLYNGSAKATLSKG